MKNILFRLYLNLMRSGAKLTRIKENKVVILNGAGRSGSNGYLFAKYLRQHHPEYDVALVEPWPSSHLPLKTWRQIGVAKYIFTTHQPFKIHRKQISIQFWHGIPLKRMGIMANNTDYKTDERNARLWRRNADMVCSSSDFYETLMSACTGIETSKYRQVGFPRLDALTRPAVTKKELLQQLFGQDDVQAQIGIFMPTFRYEMADKEIMNCIKDGNFLALPDFDAEKLNASLKAKNQFLIVKLHPYEMRLFKKQHSHFSNISFLNNDFLYQHDYDLYELLGSTDFLITDFSSIYFDYLNLNKPIIFITAYLEQYEKTRGLLFGPFKEVVPGKCVNTQTQLLEAVAAPDHYQAKRQYWRNLTNEVQSASYCEQVFTLMTKKY